MNRIPVYGAGGLSNESRTFLNMAIDTRQYSGTCDNVQHVENMLSALAESPHWSVGRTSLDKTNDVTSQFKALLTNSGTSATHLLYKALKFKLPKLKYVLVPSNSYVAVYNSILYDNDGVTLVPILSETEGCQVSPHGFVNIDYDDLEELLGKLDPEEAAIMVVHNLGNPVDVTRIHKMSGSKFLIVEDNCEGFGGRYKDINNFHTVPTGLNCLASSVSFYGNKNITCGEGGAVITEDNDVYDYLKCLRGQGESSEKWIHGHLGYNYRMSNLNASVLRGELCMANWKRHCKEKIFKHYDSLFESHYAECAITPVTKDFQYLGESLVSSPSLVNSRWMYAIKSSTAVAGELRDYLDRFGIETRPMFHNLYKHGHINTPLVDGWFPRVEETIRRDKFIHDRVVVLPSGPTLTEGEIEFVGMKVNDFAYEQSIL